jgi:hypothetical protein
MKNSNLAWCSVALVFGAVALGGCERKSRDETSTYAPPRTAEPAPPTGGELGTGGGPIAINTAIDSIVEARCDREQKCGSVGADKKFADRAACVREVQNEFRDDINTDDCPAGVDAKELGECLTEARNENCANPFDKIERVAACRTSDICRKVK